MAPPPPPATTSANQAADENEGSHTLLPMHHEHEEHDDYDFGPNPQWWSKQEEIVISGMSGRMPESGNMQEFSDNLYNGVDMITEDNRRWEPGFYDLPTRHGKIKELRKFDAGFFGVHPKQAANMDPQLKLLLETSYEAMIDAGINPQSLRGSRSGVFVANASSETSSVLTGDPEHVVGYSLTGCVRSMFANRLSYAFDFRGPSFAVDTACSSALLAFQLAVDAIRQGQCDNALVCGAHVTLTPNSALQFLRLTMLSPDGKCMSFDAKGNGYVRSECVGAIFLQKASLAKRCYAAVVHAKSNTDGYKEQGITFPSGLQQRRLLLETYKEASLDPRNIVYLEAHGTGTKIGDPQECFSATSVFCRDRQGPLLIGSVKSNAGHAEPASGIMSLAKVVFAMENCVIPQNLHFEEPNPNITGLLDGRLKVVSKNTPWTPGYVGVSSFGFGGSNTHIILKPPPKDIKPALLETSNIPILLLYPGRTPKSVENMLKLFDQRNNDAHLFSMLCEQSDLPTNQCPYRGFSINYPGRPRPPPEEGKEQTYDIQKVPTSGKRPVFLVYSGMGSQWAGMGKDLMALDLFRKAVLRCSAAIEPFGISPLKLITEGTDEDFQDNTLHCFLAICAIQIGLTDLLRHLGLEPDGIIGHSTGEMASSYADGGTTYEETMLIAYYRGRTIMSAKFPPGAMAAIGLTWEQTLKRLPNGVFPACHNAPDSVTISGDAKRVAAFVEQVQSEGVFVKSVNSSGIAFHSPCMQIIAQEMREHLTKLLPKPKLRSPKWISSSILDDKLDTDIAKYSSADYHVNNMVSPVLFHSALKKVPENSIIIEVAPHCLLQAIVKRGMAPGCQTFGLMSARHENNLEYFFQSLGKIYQAGVNFKMQNLYPKVPFPVPRGTPMLGSLLDWDHSMDWEVFTGPMKTLNCVCSYTVDPFANDSKEHYVLDHFIDGRVMYPFTGYLVLAWKAICKLRGLDWQKTPIIIEDLNVFRATIITQPVKFDVCVTLANGYFEILEEDSCAATGYISLVDDKRPLFYADIDKYPYDSTGEIELDTTDLYKEFQLRGYEYGPSFRGIRKAVNSGTSAVLAWTGNWVTFLDTLFQTNLIYERSDTLRVPIRLRYFRADPLRQAECVEELDGEKVIRCKNHFQTLGATGGGVEYTELVCQTVPKRSQAQKVTMERISFMKYHDNECLNDFPEIQADLHSYNDLCRSVAVNGIRKLVKSNANLPNKSVFEKIANEIKVPEIPEEDLESLLEDQKCVLLKTLHELLNHQNGPTINAATQKPSAPEKAADAGSAASGEKVMNLLTELEHDKLWNYCWVDRTARELFDVALQNTAGHFMKIAAIEPVSPMVLKAIRNDMHLVSPLVEGDYFLIGSNVEKMDPDLRSANSLQIYEFNVDSTDKVSDMYAGQDLLVLDRVLYRKLDIPKYLQRVKDFLRDDGFLLVNEVTNNFETAFAIAGLCGENLIASQLNGARKYGLFYEHQNWLEFFEKAGFRLTGYKTDGNLMTTVYLLHKIGSNPPDPVIIPVDDVKEFTWIEPLQKAIDERLNEPQEKTICITSTEVRDNGVIGLAVCLREENNKNRIRCIADVSLKNRSGPTVINIEDPEIKKILQQDIFMQMYRDGVWGSIKHHVLRDEHQYTYAYTEHAFLNTLVRGDLSSLKWVESGNKYYDYMPDLLPTNRLLYVYYSSLNFRDVMLATGRLAPDSIPVHFSDRDSLLGLEFVGRLDTGKRVMGLKMAQGMATTVILDTRLCWDVPDNWTMEQAATIPVVYSTAFYALIVRGRLQRGEKVLIHSGSGGVGQAAISIALHRGCEVFTTVSSEEKKKFLQHRFPELKDEHFSNSRTTDFEFHIKQVTRGRGVDVVLNSLSEDKLIASVRCLGQHGRFLEIGKFDLAKNTNLGLSVFMKNVTFHGVLVDTMFSPFIEDWYTTADLVREGIKDGSVKPLPATVFSPEKAEEAFRFMAQGKHIGKVLLKIRNEESDLAAIPKPIAVKAVRRTLCHPHHVYVVLGGLGGIGLELVQWLTMRGGRKFVLTSRSGVKTGYQARCLHFWRKSKIDVKVSSLDIADEAQTYQLIKEAREMGPVGGIFNLAMVLRDCIFENQSVQNYKEAAAPKYHGTKNLDKVSRELCNDGNLKWFVVFSSLTCGRGNAGQTNYGWANSTMERIIEQRRYDKLPGITVQWGAIGDVGVILENLGDNKTVIAGSMPQRIASCMQALDLFLCLDHPMVSSFIKAETKEKSGSGDGDIINAIAHILGVTDPNQINADANLADLGLDSLMGVEIKQALERDYDIVLSMKDIRTLTLSKLRTMAKGGPKISNKPEDVVDTSSPDIAAQLASFEEQAALQRALIGGFRMRVDLDGLKPDKACIALNQVKEGVPVFFVHSIEGIGSTLTSLSSLLPYPAYCFQCTPDAPEDKLQSLALYYVQEMKRIQPKGPYRLIGYSYGACIAFEMAVHLQKQEGVDVIQTLMLLDGSHKYMRLYRNAYRRYYNVQSDKLLHDPLFETEVLVGVTVRFVQIDYKTMRTELLALPSIKARIDRCVDLLMASGQGKARDITHYSLEAFWKKMMMADQYEPTDKFAGDVTLIRAKVGAAREEDVGNDYGIGEVVTGKVTVFSIEGDHDSFIHGHSAEKTAAIIIKCVDGNAAGVPNGSI